MKKWRLIIVTILLLLPLLAVAEQPPVIQTKVLPEGMAGVFYNAKIIAEGNSPITYTLSFYNDGTSGYPSGMKLSHSGTLYGNPESAGTYTFTVCAACGEKEAYQQYTLTVKPFDETKLRRGGTDAGIVGNMADSNVGVSNALQGGKATMQAGNIYFINSKGFLYEATPPYAKPVKRFKATAYKWMDAENNHLYYYQRYLDARGTSEDGSDNKYVTRIARDPLGEKGRITLTSLTQKDISTLSVTSQVVLFVKGEKHGVLTRLPLEGGLETAIHCYHQGREVYALSAIPYNGAAYFQGERDKCLYRVFLDGEVTEKLTEEKINAYTIVRYSGRDMLCYTNAKDEVVIAELNGQNAQRLGTIKGRMLNADGAYLYYLDMKHIPHRINIETGSQPEKLSNMKCDQVYLFQDGIILHKRNSKQFYFMGKAPGAEALRLNKE